MIWKSRRLRALIPFSRGEKHTKKNLPSMVRALHQIVPKRVMREVLATSADRRQWAVLAAAWVGVSEHELFNAAAQAMGLEMQRRVPVPDLIGFGERARSILGELRRIGAVVVVKDNAVVGIISTDPAEVRGLSLYDGKVPLSVATWSDIARALDAAERIIMESESNVDLKMAREKRETCKKIIDILVREAAAHGSQSVEVVTIAGKTRYQFFTSHGKYASGSIRPEVVSDLLEYLGSVEGTAVASESQGSVALRSLGSSSNFKLSWGSSALVSEKVEVDRNTVGMRREGGDGESISTRSTGLPSEECSRDAVLVVDDNPMFCRVLERLLRREGLSPSFAENGLVALEKLHSVDHFVPRLIICDLHMPQMNGRELLAKVRGDSRTSGIPIIMLTSDDDVDAETQLLNEGADAFVPKAKDPRVLTAQVQRLLRRSPRKEAA